MSNYYAPCFIELTLLLLLLMNSKNNHLYERALRTVYKNRDLSFDDHFKKGGSFTTQCRNIQTLSIEFFKLKKMAFQWNIKQYFWETPNYELQLKIQNALRLEFFKYFAAKMWDIVSEEIKNLKDLDKFKKKIRNREPKNCHCKLCWIYLRKVGYIGWAVLYITIYII